MRWLPLALARLTLGVLFVSTGWGKVHDLGSVAAYFAQLGIPAPAFEAALVGWSELVCGALLLVGLLSRLATIPLIVTMIVALATARSPHVHGLTDLFRQIELTYLLLLVFVALFGPGWLSIDAAIGHGLRAPRLERQRRVPPAGLSPHGIP